MTECFLILSNIFSPLKKEMTFYLFVGIVHYKRDLLLLFIICPYPDHCVLKATTLPLPAMKADFCDGCYILSFHAYRHTQMEIIDANV